MVWRDYCQAVLEREISEACVLRIIISLMLLGHVYCELSALDGHT